MCVCVWLFNACGMIRSSHIAAGEQARQHLTKMCEAKAGWREQKRPRGRRENVEAVKDKKRNSIQVQTEVQQSNLFAV